MALKGSGPAEDWDVVGAWGAGTRWTEDTDPDAATGGLCYQAYPTETMERTATLLETDGGTWLIDPLDTPALDDLIAAFDGLDGVALICDHHTRDAPAIAARHDQPVHVPAWWDPLPDRLADGPAPVERFTDTLPGTALTRTQVLDNRIWQEDLLTGDDTLVLGDVLGTTSYTGNRLAMNPLMRLRPPRAPLEDLAPARIAVGHGAPVTADAPAALDRARSASRLSTAPALAKMLWATIRG